MYDVCKGTTDNRKIAPAFLEEPQGVYYKSSAAVKLSCQAKGVPLPEISWLKNGRKPDNCYCIN